MVEAHSWRRSKQAVEESSCLDAGFDHAAERLKDRVNGLAEHMVSVDRSSTMTLALRSRTRLKVEDGILRTHLADLVRKDL